MSISSTNRKAGPYTGNGITTALPFSFKVFSASDVLVVRTDLSGAETDLVLTTHYTVSLNADQDSNPGGTVNLVAPAATGYLTTITSQVADLQPLTLTNAGGFYPKVINDALDRVTIQIQQLAGLVSRSLKTAISTPDGVTTQLPSPVGYKVLAWNAEGTAIENVDPSGTSALSDALAYPSGSSLIGFIRSLTGSFARTTEEILREYAPSLKDFGATCNGSSDDSDAWEMAALSGAKRIYVPPNTTVSAGVLSAFSGLNGVVFFGDGFLASRVRIFGTTGDIFTFSNCQHSGIVDCGFFYNDEPTDGWVIKFTNDCFEPVAKIRLDYCYNGVWAEQASESAIDVISRYSLGQFVGVKIGGTASKYCYGANIHYHGDNPAPVAITSYKAYAGSTAFTLGQVTDTGGKVYVCTQAGTTSAASPPTSTSGKRFDVDITDGTVKWRFLCLKSATHITQDSNAYSVRIAKSFGLNCAVTFRMTDSVNAASYASEPKWVYLGIESDHAYSAGIALLAGQGAYFNDNAWVGSSLKGNGILVDGTFRGEMTTPESMRCLGNAQHGLLINTGAVYDIKGTYSGNSQQSSGTYHGITIAASVTDFKIDATAGKSVDGGTTQGYGVSLSAGCNRYTIQGNFSGNVTGTIAGHTPSITKVVGDTIPSHVSRTLLTINPGSTSATFAHGLGVAPASVQWSVRNTLGTVTAYASTVDATNVIISLSATLGYAVVVDVEARAM